MPCVAPSQGRHACSISCCRSLDPLTADELAAVPASAVSFLPWQAQAQAPRRLSTKLISK